MTRPRVSEFSTKLIRSFDSLRGTCFGSRSIPPPSQKLHLRAQPQKHYSLWLGKRVIAGMHIAAHSDQVLKTRAVAHCLIQQPFNSVEFSKIILHPHECEPEHQEPHEDRIALQDLLRTFTIQQRTKMLSKDFQPFDQRFEVTVEHARPHLTASSAEEATNQPSSSSLPASSSTSTSEPQPAIPDPPVFN